MDPLERKRPLQELFPQWNRSKSDRTKGERTMFKPSDPQKPLFDAGGLLPAEKRARCEKTWAGPFREHALPILRKIEGDFADLFDPSEGRPNRPVELVVGTLILKEMGDLTDDEALTALEYDLRWAYAFQREPGELHLSQKTLHNFRAKLIQKEKAKVAFRRVTDELVGALGVKVSQQRVDSTHIVSNIAILSRLGLMAETIRVFLRKVKEEDPKEYEGIPAPLRERYREETRYEDAKRPEGVRRLGVMGRDAWRLRKRFEDHEILGRTREWKLLNRLVNDQCHPTLEPEEPKKDDDDHGEGGACVVVKEAREVASDSLQTPHDAQVTYSGRKGKGYEAQVVETCTPGNRAQFITEVEVTPSCGSDATQTVPLVKTLTGAGHKPEELVADTGYGGAPNAAALATEGVRLLAPVPGPEHAKLPEGSQNQAPEGPCPKEEAAALQWLRKQEAAPDFRKRYAIRAGSEATNSELKRAHGMRKLRVRSGKRVKLSVYFKALACNLKRALRAWLRGQPEDAVVPV